MKLDVHFIKHFMHFLFLHYLFYVSVIFRNDFPETFDPLFSLTSRFFSSADK